MIEKLTLNNFRKVVSGEMEFTSGINVIRGGNEASKSTRLEAIAYALFGSKALRNTLEDAVSWGMDVKSLKVELVIRVGDDAFTFKRGKSGAEVVKNGATFVTGQNEVSNFAAELLGADVSVAAKLMFASQGGVRGALEEGPKALSALIEDLAGFSAFDQILEAAQSKLVLGTPTLLEERLKGAESTLDAAMQNLPVKPDDEDHHARITEFCNQIGVYEHALPELTQRAGETEATFNEATRQYLHRNDLEQAVQSAVAKMGEAKIQEETLKATASIEVDTSQIADLQTTIAASDDHDNRYRAYQKFQTLPDGMRYPGTAEAFEAKVEEVAAAKDMVRANLDRFKDTLRKAQNSRINHDTCDKCGQDITHLDTVKATNEKVDAVIAEVTPMIEATQQEMDVLSQGEAQFAAIRRFATQFDSAIRGLDHHVLIDTSTHPLVATWNGVMPSSIAPTAPRAELAAIMAKVKALDAAKAKLELAVDQRDTAMTRLLNAENTLRECTAPTATEYLAITEVKDSAAIDFACARSAVVALQQELDGLNKDHASATALWSSAQARIDDAGRVIDQCKTDLSSLAFNNALIKKLRAIRPLIANKLWNTVLASVSVMFSQMRGEPSAVSKEKEGFRVNGQAVESLSGSTLDVLGIALRCSLLRTFVPQCGLLVLDEPAQGCDAERTESMLGFLQSVGMAQTLLVTHETVSESIADNIIEI